MSNAQIVARVCVAVVSAGILVGCANVLPQNTGSSVEIAAPHTRYRIVHSFGKGRDGKGPQAALIVVAGTLYGTTAGGGAYGEGTVFSVTPSGAEHILHSFGKHRDGTNPVANLLYVNGSLCGTTSAGGAYGRGTVFTLSLKGVEHVLHSFGKGADGADPVANLIELDGVLYGTTLNGGTNYTTGYRGGTVYSLRPNGTRYRIVHSFGQGTDGSSPSDGLIDVAGTLYGTTFAGGKGAIASGGTVFSLKANGEEHVLYSFSFPFYEPWSSLVDVDGTFYGTTGADNAIYSFKVGTQARVIRSLNSSDGGQLRSAVIYINGKLYGTTSYGGPRANYSIGSGGVVFSVSRSGAYQVLHAFGSRKDGDAPESAVVAVGGTLYGTTFGGGAYASPVYSSATYGGGTVFALTP